MSIISSTSFDPTQIDAFGRLRTSNPWTLFESALTTGKDTLKWHEIDATGGTATHLPNESAVEMAVTSSTGSRMVRQSRKYMHYQPGKSKLIFMTGVLADTAPVAGIRTRVGCFDDDNDKTVDSGGNGFYIELDGTTINACKRSYVTGAQVDTEIPQSGWSGDKLDGTGPSGLDLDPSTGTVYWWDMEWLGVGDVRFGIVYDNELILCHTFKHASQLPTTYISRADLPCRYEIENVSGASGMTMKQICSTVISEGGFNPTGKVWPASTGTALVSVGTSEIPLLSVRLKTTNRRDNLNPELLSIMSTTNGNACYRLYLTQGEHANPLTGATWTGDPHAESGLEYDLAATAFSNTNSIKIHEGFFSNNQDGVTLKLKNEIIGGSDILGNSDIYTVTAEGFSGTESLACSVNFREI